FFLILRLRRSTLFPYTTLFRSWLGMNTGLKSYRCKVFDKFPRTNIPDYFPSWGEYDSFIKLLIKTNCIDNAKKIWNVSAGKFVRSEEHTSELQSRFDLVCRLLL